MLRLGIDVGGTHTDAVLMDGVRIVCTHKAGTTSDVGAGIVAAAEAVLRLSGIARSQLDAVIIGTTQFTNAIVERRGLSPVFALRIGAQSTRALPPFCDWPEDAERAVVGATAMIDGGHEFDGTPIAPLDEQAFEAACESMRATALQSVAVCSVFSFVNPATETWVAERLRRLPFVEHVSVSAELGGVGLYQRENATLLNAALRPMAKQVVAAYRSALAELGLSVRLFISQNDGTLMDAEFAARYPVLTISSGPTNSMRGAAHLTGLGEAMVIDVGGTTSDVGMLTNGYPRRSGGEVSVGGVATNFRMPDVLSIGVGGGSVVSADGARVGPVSVGHELPQKALCFGGDVTTATDVACARGLIDLGPAVRKAALGPAQIERATAAMRGAFERALERMKVTPEPLPLIAVGGAAFLVPDDLPGVARLVRPPHAEVANAVGAALGQVGAECELVYSRGRDSRGAVLEKARAIATDRAVAAGADRATVEITDIDEVPISYLEDAVVRIRVKAAGAMRV